MKGLISIPLSIGFFGLVLFSTAPGDLFAVTDPDIHYVAPGGSCGAVTPCYGDIQSAINAANNGDEIRVAQGTYNQTSTGKDIVAGAWIIDKKIALRGGYTTTNWNTANPETNSTVINPQNNGVGVHVRYQIDTSYGDVIVDGFSITQGNATETIAGTDSGGGIFISNTTHITVSIQNCKVYGNTAERSAAGIKSLSSDNLRLIGNEIYDNQGDGVSMSAGNSPVFVDNLVYNNVGFGIGIFTAPRTGTDISNNEVMGNQGSGIRLNSVSGGSLTNNNVYNNHTTGGGGGINVSGAINDFLISNNTVSGNSSLQGGGINISGSIARIENNIIHSNFMTASSNGGGGLYVDSGATGAYVLVSGNEVYSNTTTNQGGGMLVLGMVDVLDNTIKDNNAYSGGGIVATATGIIGNNLISGNTAKSGAGIRAVSPMGLLLQQNKVIDNHATSGEGGGMNLWGGFSMDITLDGNQVISNTASTKGGGIYLECPSDADPIDISNTVLSGNMAIAGSGLYSTVCDTNIAYSTVASNRGASGDGVGLYLRDPLGVASYVIENSIIAKQTVGLYVESGVAELEATFWGNEDWVNDTDTGTGASGTIALGTLTYSGDPAFIDPANDDYHITENSPVIGKE